MLYLSAGPACDDSEAGASANSRVSALTGLMCLGSALMQVRKILWELLRLIPDAEAARHVNVTKVQELIYPLGLSTKRAVMLKRFSEDYLDKQVGLSSSAFLNY